MSDGWGIIAFSSGSYPLEPHGYREAGTLLFFRLTQQKIFSHLGMNPMQTIGLINLAFMLSGIGMAGYLLRLMHFTPAQRRLGWWLIFSSLGFTQMLLGHIELYPMVQFFIIATLVMGFAAIWAG